jgi:hypothetical protein
VANAALYFGAVAARSSSVTSSTLSDILLEEMRGEAVPQRVWRHALLDSRGLGGGTNGAAELAGRQRLDWVAAGKQPASRQQQAAPPPFPPPSAQQFEQLRRQHRVTISLPII